MYDIQRALKKPDVLFRKYVSNRYVICIMTPDEIDAVRISFRPTYINAEVKRKERYMRKCMDALF